MNRIHALQPFLLWLENLQNHHPAEYILLGISVLGLLQFGLMQLPFAINLFCIVGLHAFWAAINCKTGSCGPFQYILWYALPSMGISLLMDQLIKRAGHRMEQQFAFEYPTREGKLLVTNPFRGMCILGGAGSGKTSSLIKPTVAAMAKAKFTGIVYDFKEFDISRCVCQHYQQSGIEQYYINFFDMHHTHRVNPLDPAILQNPAYAGEAAHVLFTNLNGTMDRPAHDSYFMDAAEAALAAVIWRLKEDFPRQCNLPTAIILCMQQDFTKLAAFISGNTQASLMGATFLQSLVNPKTGCRSNFHGIQFPAQTGHSGNFLCTVRK